MVRKEIKYRRRPASPPGLAEEMSMLSEEMRRAFRSAYEAYTRLGIRFAVCGGLAAGAYGEPRSTRDIDFLVGDEAFMKTGPLISFAKPMPLQAYDVAIDPIPLPEDPQRWKVLDDALSHSHVDRTLGFEVLLLPALALAYMKLASPRGKDRGDIVAMIRAGSVDVDQLGELVAFDEELASRLAAVVAEIAEEE
jgi:hypothetical protein